MTRRIIELLVSLALGLPVEARRKQMAEAGAEERLSKSVTAPSSDKTESVSSERPKAPDWLLGNIAEASKNAQKIFYVYVGILAYCSLTLIGTSDKQLIFDKTTKLPLIDLDVSLNVFTIIVPILAIAIFLYLQLYTYRIKGLVNDLHKNYPPVEQRRLYPWILNIVADPEPGSIGLLQRA